MVKKTDIDSMKTLGSLNPDLKLDAQITSKRHVFIHDYVVMALEVVWKKVKEVDQLKRPIFTPCRKMWMECGEFSSFEA